MEDNMSRADKKLAKCAADLITTILSMIFRSK